MADTASDGVRVKRVRVLLSLTPTDVEALRAVAASKRQNLSEAAGTLFVEAAASVALRAKAGRGY